MTLLQHVYALKNLLAHGAPSDDFSYSDRLIAHFLEVARARLIEEKIDKYHYISEQTLQSLCLTLAKSQFHNCCDGPQSDCLVLKSTTQVPKFLNSRWGSFMKVMDLEGRVIPDFNLTQNRFSEFALIQPETGWFMHDNYLYIVNNSFLEKVLLNALFDSPAEISDLNCPTSGDNCPDYLDTEFPIDPDLVDPMYRLAMTFLIESIKLPKDEEQNASDG